MKRKRMDRDIWTSIREKRYEQKRAQTERFRGIVSLLHTDIVEPASVWDTPRGRVAICESGMKWLQILPEDGNHMITAMLSAAGEIAVVYVDIVAGYGFCEDDVVWYDDLYLDLIVFDDGSIVVDDQDELDEAYRSGDISPELYALAEREKEALLAGILKDYSALCEYCRAALSLFGE